MKKAISKINPFRYAKKLHIGYIWLIAVLLLLVVGVICSGAKVYKYSPILSVVSYSLAAISLNEHLYSVHTVDLLQTTNNLIQLWRNYLMNNSNLYQTL